MSNAPFSEMSIEASAHDDGGVVYGRIPNHDEGNELLAAAESFDFPPAPKSEPVTTPKPKSKPGRKKKTGGASEKRRLYKLARDVEKKGPEDAFKRRFKITAHEAVLEWDAREQKFGERSFRLRDPDAGP